jgi:hypothetical protein
MLGKEGILYSTPPTCLTDLVHFVGYILNSLYLDSFFLLCDLGIILFLESRNIVLFNMIFKFDVYSSN